MMQPIEMLTAYITYARAKINPVLTEEASNALVSAYVEMRKVGTDVRTQEKRITATTRQLESMIRLSEAHARMRFSERVELGDVQEAGRLIRSALRESAVGFELVSSSSDRLLADRYMIDGSIDWTD
jgi:DNA replication licensing factor MCM4